MLRCPDVMLSQYGNYSTAAAAATDAIVDINLSTSRTDNSNAKLSQCWQHELSPVSVAGQPDYPAQQFLVPLDAIMISPRASF